MKYCPDCPAREHEPGAVLKALADGSVFKTIKYTRNQTTIVSALVGAAVVMV
ncbi:MAG: hypothetical protein JKY17_02820 [Magnetovibrio sp.]|nr:hypothetical protein [Magnetovibrio sp.]